MSDVARLGLPKKADIQDLIDSQLVVSLAQDWSTAGATFPQGSLVAFDLQQARRDPEHLKPVVLFAPGPRESLGAAAATRDALLVTTFDNVRGRAFVYRRRPDATWQRARLHFRTTQRSVSPMPTCTATTHSCRWPGFCSPPASGGSMSPEHAAGRPHQDPAAKFDASRDAVDQFEATSSDGTRSRTSSSIPSA